MTDLRERFMQSDQIVAPDLWADIEERLDDVGLPVGRVRVDGSRSSAGVRRFVTIAAAIAIVAVAFGWLLRSIAVGTVVPGTAPSEVYIPAGTAVFGPGWIRPGWIAYSDGDGMLMMADPTGAHAPMDVGLAQGSPLAWSPGGDELLLDSGVVLDANGTKTRLVPAAAGVRGASYAPDGSSIVFGADDGSLRVVDRSGAARILLAANGVVWSYFPAWSPDGATIAYISHSNATQRWSIWAMDPDGTDQRQIADLSDRKVTELAPLAWSPDGSTLAFSTDAACCDRRAAISTLSAATGEIKSLTAENGSWWASWSPDGQRIAFMLHHQLYTMAADGSDVRAIAGAAPGGYTAAWAPSG